MTPKLNMEQEIISSLANFVVNFKEASPSLRLWYENGELKFSLNSKSSGYSLPSRRNFTSPQPGCKRTFANSEPRDPPETLQSLLSSTDCTPNTQTVDPLDEDSTPIVLKVPEHDSKMNLHSEACPDSNDTSSSSATESSLNASDALVSESSEKVKATDSDPPLNSRGYPLDTDVRYSYGFCANTGCSLCKLHGLSKPLKFRCKDTYGCEKAHWHIYTEQCCREDLPMNYGDIYKYADEFGL